MKKMLMILLVATLSLSVSSVKGETFGSGANAFSLDFTDTLSGSSNPTPSQTTATQTQGTLDGFGIVNYDYQMGKHEITQSQFDAYRSSVSLGANPYWATNGANRPANQTSWFEAAQFVNWLNTSEGHQAAYQMSDSVIDIDGSTFDAWDSSVAANGGTNLYRHKDAVYFLPSEDEWVKAAYWNGSEIQEYAIGAGVDAPSNGVVTGSNYYDGGYAVGSPDYLWDVASGGEEINGTFDMMGNLWEWSESAWNATYGDTADRSIRGGSFGNNSDNLSASNRYNTDPNYESGKGGFRVASVPEPCTLAILAIGGVTAIRRRRAKH
jgi:formylglycine-generating enzyme required for sulfatase activity